MDENEKDKVLRVADSNGWKYSWHMILNQWGGIDFHNKDNLKKIAEGIRDRITWCNQELSDAIEAREILKTHLDKLIQDEEITYEEAYKWLKY